MLVRLAQLSSRIYTRLSSARSLQQSPVEWASAILELDSELSQLATSIQTVIRLNRPIEEFTPSDMVSIDQALIIQYTYYVLVFQIHTHVTYPWFDNGSKLKSSENLRQLVKSSTKKVIDASRAALMSTAFIRINADTSIQ